jgi:glycosyltransferase involved in cell wall biosynthesis
VATFVGLKESGVDLAVVCPLQSTTRPQLIAAGIELIDIPLKRRIDREAIRMLRQTLEARRCDILHVLGNKALQNGLAATKGLSTRVIAYRGIVGNVSFFNPVSWMRFLNPRVDRIVCVANAVRDYFLAMQPAWLRVPESKLVRIYKGHSLSWYTAEPAELHSVGIPEGAFVVSCVANYRPRKGIEYLIDALARLPREWPVHLLLVGLMDDPRLSKRIARSPVRDRIHRVGRRTDAPALAAASDVFVMPSIKREGLARSLIEAMAYARPAIVTDCGGSPELVLDGECGIVVAVRNSQALADAIELLYRDPNLRLRYGLAARERIEKHFRIEDTIAETLALYRSVVPDHGTN